MGDGRGVFQPYLQRHEWSGISRGVFIFRSLIFPSKFVIFLVCTRHGRP